MGGLGGAPLVHKIVELNALPLELEDRHVLLVGEVVGHYLGRYFAHGGQEVGGRLLQPGVGQHAHLNII